MKKRGGTMTCRSNELFSILLIASSIFFLNPPTQAQACTPTVFLFRHAEDKTNTKTNLPELTPAGVKHASLYPEMVDQYLSMMTDLCPIKRVLAMYDHNTDGSKGTTNPFKTAEPLAKHCCGSEPEMYLTDLSGNNNFLYELISSSPNGGLAPEAIGRFGRIFYALQPTLNSQGSVAIFWTQQGIPDVSQALGVPPVSIPGVPPNDPDPALSWPGRLRSSVNKFTWTGNSYVAQYPFTVQDPPTSRLDIKPAQCFRSSDFSTKCHCSYSGILGTVPAGGKFCYLFSSETGPDNYGYCL
jgi:hypothetical protein